MKLSHFDALQPICPTCRAERKDEHPLSLAVITARDGDDILEGSLHCTAEHCRLEYPIIDGIPLLLPEPRQFIADNIEHLTARADLSALTESILGDCLGPHSGFDITRQHLSSYSWDGYADLDPEESDDTPVQPNGVGRCLHAGLERITERLKAPVLDIGCAVGRSSFELAQSSEALILGVDTNISMLRHARSVLRHRRLRYPRRRIGIVYDRREFEVEFSGMERVDFWACNGMALPFKDRDFGLVSALQVLDSVSSPHSLLLAIASALRIGGSAIFATPYDWSPAVTPLESWIGGHSQRGVTGGAAEPLLRALLTAGAHPLSIAGLALRDEITHFPWHTRLHDRSVMLYDVHIWIAEAVQPVAAECRP